MATASLRTDGFKFRERPAGTPKIVRKTLILNVTAESVITILERFDHIHRINFVGFFNGNGVLARGFIEPFWSKSVATRVQHSTTRGVEQAPFYFTAASILLSESPGFKRCVVEYPDGDGVIKPGTYPIRNLLTRAALVITGAFQFEIEYTDTDIV